MASDASFHVHGEVIEVKLTGNLDAFSINPRKTPSVLDQQLESMLSSSVLSPDSATDVKDLCGVLERAESAIVATSHCGLKKALSTLIHCVNTALQAKKCRSQAGDSTRPGPASTIRHDATSSKEFLPPVLIVVPDEEHGRHVTSLLSRILAMGRLSLKIEHYLDCVTFYPDGYGSADIVVYTEYRLSLILAKPKLVGLERTHLMMWYKAHRIFGPDFCQFLYAHGWRLIYDVTSRIKHFHKDIRSILVGPRDQLRSLSLIRDELLGSGRTKLVLGAEPHAHHPPSSGLALDHQQEEDDRSVTAESAPKGSAFFVLPVEVRNLIYDLVMGSGTVFKISMFRPAGRQRPCRAVLTSFFNIYNHEPSIFDHELGKWKDMPAEHTFALSRVNKQLAGETLSMFYSSNTFEFERFGSLNVFIQSTGSSSGHLRHLKITGNIGFLYAKPGHVFKCFAPSLALESLSIDYESLITRRSNRKSGQLRIHEFAYEIRDYLMSWHDAHKDASGRSDVLKLVGIYGACRRCRNDLYGDAVCTGEKHVCSKPSRWPNDDGSSRPCGKSTNCGRKCSTRRLRNVKRWVREQIAGVLGMAG